MRKFRTDAKPINLAVAFHLYWICRQSLHEVATQFGIHHTNLMFRFRRFGIPTRCKKEACLGVTRRYGKDNSAWKGGRFIDKRGYVHIRVNGKNLYEHRLIAEKALGRPLKKNEAVHHIDGNCSNNSNNNLIICSKHYHHWLHAKLNDFKIGKHIRR